MHNPTRKNWIQYTPNQIEAAKPKLTLLNQNSEKKFFTPSTPFHVKWLGQALAQREKMQWRLLSAEIDMELSRDHVYVRSMLTGDTLEIGFYRDEEEGRPIWYTEMLDYELNSVGDDPHTEVARSVSDTYTEWAAKKGIYYAFDNVHVVNKWAFLALMMSGYNVKLLSFDRQKPSELKAFLDKQYREEVSYWCGYVGNPAKWDIPTKVTGIGDEWTLVENDTADAEVWRAVKGRVSLTIQLSTGKCYIGSTRLTAPAITIQEALDENKAFLTDYFNVVS